MSIGRVIISEIGYNLSMAVSERGATADYLERNWIKYMGDYGIKNQTEMAAILGISQPYFNMLLEGKKTKIKYATCLNIAQVFGDFSIMEIQGYEQPDILDLLRVFAPEMRGFISNVIKSTESQGIPIGSPEADKIFRDELSKFSARESSKEKPR